MKQRQIQKQAKRFDILGIGTTAVDDFLHVLNYPGPDRNVRVISKDRKFGGLIGTAIAAAAQAGSTCAYGGTFGYDELSESLRESFLQMGIDCNHALTHREGQPTHSIIIADDTNHTRNIFFDLQKEYSSFEGTDFQMISDAKVVAVDQTAINIAVQAKKMNIPVVADMELTDRDDCDFYMTQIDHLILPFNIGQELTEKKGPAEIVLDLHERHERICTAVTCGENGCYYKSQAAGRSVHFQKAFSVAPIETTGCGDVFHGVYASALASGDEVSLCIQLASAAAAIYASRPSGWEHLPNRSEIESLMKEQQNSVELLSR